MNFENKFERISKYLNRAKINYTVNQQDFFKD